MTAAAETSATAGRMDGRVCVLTGATNGIGRAAALELARRGARLVLVARNAERAEATRAHVRDGCGSDAVDVVLADLASLADVRRAADAILARCPRIDVLMNNAGVLMMRRKLTVDGFETTFAVNHLAYFALTSLLEERLRASAPSRVVSTASEAHRFRGFDWDNLQGEKQFRPWTAYGISKLCNILWNRELARRLEGSGVTANCWHPGGVATGLGTQRTWYGTALAKLIAPWLRTPDQGADTGAFLACAPEGAEVTGGYFKNRREARPSSLARDDEAARRLWRLSAELTGLDA